MQFPPAGWNMSDAYWAPPPYRPTMLGFTLKQNGRPGSPGVRPSSLGCWISLLSLSSSVKFAAAGLRYSSAWVVVIRFSTFLATILAYASVPAGTDLGKGTGRNRMLPAENFCTSASVIVEPLAAVTTTESVALDTTCKVWSSVTLLA